MDTELQNELSLDDEIAHAYAEFNCAYGATNRRVKWRALAALIRKRSEQKPDETP